METKSADAFTEQKLRDLLGDVIEAAEAVVNAWERGDLAGAVNRLELTADNARDWLQE